MTVTLAAFTPITHDDCAVTVTIADVAHPTKALDIAGAPLHVAGKIALNGVVVPGVADWDVNVVRGEATHVTLWIDPQISDVAAPFRGKHGEWAHGGIDGQPVLCPAKDNGTGSGWTWDEERELIECEFFVGRVVLE